MATLEQKLNNLKVNYSANHCVKVVEIFEVGQRQCVSKLIRYEEMLYELCLAHGAYNIIKHQDTAPTATQLRKQHTNVRNRAKNLLNDLETEIDTHFLNSLACSIAGTKTPIKIADEEYKNIMSDIYKKLEDLGTSLKWLSSNLDPCTADNFNYLHTKLNSKRRSPAENLFIKDIALILTKHLGKGGYYLDAHKNEYLGWKIDCVKYLLDCVEVKRSPSQILAVLNESKPFKSDNNSSK